MAWQNASIENQASMIYLLKNAELEVLMKVESLCAFLPSDRLTSILHSQILKKPFIADSTI